MATSVAAALILLAWWSFFTDRTLPPGRRSDGLGTLPHAAEFASSNSGVVAQANAAEPAPAAEDEWTRRWRELDSSSEASARHDAKEKLIEALALIDPLRAIEWSRHEPDADLRLRLLEAAMRGWGGADPKAALAWSASQDVMDPGLARSAVFHGAAAQDPENAIRLANEISQEDPTRAADCGSSLVAALARAGEFGKAADFAASGNVDLRVNWLNDAYSRWATQSPHDALKHVAQQADPEIKQAAMNAVLARWACNDPLAVAQYGLLLDHEMSRQFALSTALRAWVAADPVEAASWINERKFSSELDSGAAYVATHPEAIRQPAIALGWAEIIQEPQLRARVLATVVHHWAKKAPEAARQYAESRRARPEERAEIFSAFETGFDPISLLP